MCVVFVAAVFVWGRAQRDCAALIDSLESPDVQTPWSSLVFVVRRLRFSVGLLALRRWRQEKAAIFLSAYAICLVQQLLKIAG